MSSSENNIRVGIAGNALVVSFLAADAPRVWRTDMGQLLNAALEVQNNQGKYTLVMKRNGAPDEEIGTFNSKEDAVKALQMITNALLDGKSCSPQKKCGWFKKMLKILWGIVSTLCVLFVLFGIFMHLANRHVPASSIESSSTKAPTSAPSGVPTPADEILGK